MNTNVLDTIDMRQLGRELQRARKRKGLTQDEAIRRARLEFGNVTAIKERAREAHGLRVVDDFVADVRLAFRTARKHLVLSAGIVAMLALGIGISSSVFTVVDAVALRAHVDRDRETYFHAFASYAVEGGSRGKWGQVSLPDFLALAQAHSVRDLSGYSQWLAGIGSGD